MVWSMRKILTVLMIILASCSSQEEPPVKSTLGSGEGEKTKPIDDEGQSKEPVKEKTVEEKNAECSLQFEEQKPE